jgi:putative heme iron utilization protein
MKKAKTRREAFEFAIQALTNSCAELIENPKLYSRIVVKLIDLRKDDLTAIDQLVDFRLLGLKPASRRAVTKWTPARPADA